jgi:hypothetical protein
MKPTASHGLFAGAHQSTGPSRLWGRTVRHLRLPQHFQWSYAETQVPKTQQTGANDAPGVRRRCGGLGVRRRRCGEPDGARREECRGFGAGQGKVACVILASPFERL